MTPGQTRIFVLIILLLALEAVRNKNVGNFFKNAVNQWVTALNGAAGKTSSSTGGTSGK